MTKSVMRLAAVLVFALSTSACSTIDSAISDVVGDDTPAAPADVNGFPPDTAPPSAASDAAAPTTPDLAAIPEKPTGVMTPDAQRDTANSLAADANRARYSSDALRGGTEAAAAPPGPAPEPGSATVADNAPPPSQPAAAPPPSQADMAPPPPADSTVPGPGAPAVGDDAPPPSAPAAPVMTASMAPPPGAQPAVPAVPGAPGAMPTAVSDAGLGFRPSSAPALDPSISQFVPAPIIARYQQTAANAGAATGPVQPSPSPDPAVAVNGRGRTRAMGGPEAMTGSVVANLDALNQASPSVYANANGMPPAAVVMFANDGIALDASGRAQVRAAVSAFQQRGGTGFIKVVGHSSSRTGNMPVEKHLVAIFAKSQARANAVAKEIIREGVPASRVLVEAVGDSQPVYYESMPQGEAGNRRAEIFIQS